MTRRAATPAVFALALGCTGDLLPNESVLGVDRPVEVVYGDEGSELGTSVAWNGASWAAAAPGAGEVWVDGVVDPVDGPATWVGWVGDTLVRAGPGGVTVDGEVVPGFSGSVFAASPLGLFAWSSGRLTSSDGVGADVGGVQALAADEQWIVALACESSCEPRGWLVGPSMWFTVVGWGELLTAAGRGGAIAFDHGEVCVGNPELDDPDGAGSVSCTDGRFIEGEPGDHLGTAIGGGYAAGTFNKWVVPPRARIVPLDGGEVLVLEEGAENQLITLAGDDAALVIGAPFHPHGGMPSGAVFVVSR